MITSRIASALVALSLTDLGPVARAQVAYIPPGADQPVFGGEFALAEPGPVAGYWPTECRVWSIQAHEHRDGPPPSPALDAAFKRFVSGIIAERPDYGDLGPPMSQAMRRRLQTYWPSLNQMGRASAAKKIGSDKAGNDRYVLDQAGGATHWNLTVNADGKIQTAFICQGQGV